MILHKYHCSNRPPLEGKCGDFYTTFKPIFSDEPAFCSNCGHAEKVTYKGVLVVGSSSVKIERE